MNFRAIVESSIAFGAKRLINARLVGKCECDCFKLSSGPFFMLKLGNIYIDFFGLGIEDKLRL